MDNRPERYTKLDSYDYDFMFSNGSITDILISIETPHDVDIADIASEITATDGDIYVEGHYFKFIDMKTVTIGREHYLKIKVEEN